MEIYYQDLLLEIIKRFMRWNNPKLSNNNNYIPSNNIYNKILINLILNINKKTIEKIHKILEIIFKTNQLKINIVHKIKN